MSESTFPSAEAIEVQTTDGLTLRGQAWANESHWAILFHEVGQDLDAWLPLLPYLFGRGYSVLTLDLRGHGISDGEWDAERIALDLRAALDFARGRGATLISFVGAGESAIPALTEGFVHEFLGLVLLSAGPLGSHTVDDLRGDGVAKLYIAGTQDTASAVLAEQLRNRSVGWAVLMRVPTDESGTTLLAGLWAKHVEEQALYFLEEQRYRVGAARRQSQFPDGAEALIRRLFS
jgi:pimeloyl-ACP methyl ester carboxylesterase